MIAKSSIAFLLNPVVESPSDYGNDALHRVEAALSVLDRHRKRPTINSEGSRLSPCTRSKISLVMSPLASKILTSSGDELRRFVLGSPQSRSLVTECALATPSKPRRKRIRVRTPTPCTVGGCSNMAVTKGYCVRHGGGARCEFEGCEKRAKKNKRCFTHGGNSQCQQPGCQSKSKRYGYCWAHGGGIMCTIEGCDKVGAQGGFCWAHGGGSRCRMESCTKRSYQKHDYYCSAHYKANAMV